MRAKEYEVMCMAVESGVAYGYNRAHKHVDDPDEVTVKNAIEQAVIDSMCEWFDFDHDQDDEPTPLTEGCRCVGGCGISDDEE